MGVLGKFNLSLHKQIKVIFSIWNSDIEKPQQEEGILAHRSDDCGRTPSQTLLDTSQQSNTIGGENKVQ